MPQLLVAPAVAVKVSAMLTGYSTATFGATEQLAFRTGVAGAATVAVSDVFITAISDDTASDRRHRRRQLLALSVVVDYSVAVDADQSAAVMSVLTDDTAVAASLSSAGLTSLEQLSTLSLSAAAVPPMLGDEVEEGSGGGGDQAGLLAGAIVGAIVVVGGGAVAYLMVRRRKKGNAEAPAPCAPCGLMPAAEHSTKGASTVELLAKEASAVSGVRVSEGGDGGMDGGAHLQGITLESHASPF
mmetsp:Transcript_24583/g.80336  ORF Transcript_24583/g.80336 Transcript_24583/m.80336 type:complete len:243 (+) Transcript_24583:4453-5181(+)